MIEGNQANNEMGVALIGLGMVAQTHVSALAELEPGIKLKGVYARTAQSRREFLDGRNLAGPLANYGSIDQIAADESVDFAILLTPPNARLDIVRTLADAGKHILMEKPVERGTDAASEIVDHCEKRNVLLGIVFQHRMRAGSRQLAKMMLSGEAGNLAVAEIEIPWWREQSYYDEPGRGTYARDGGGVLISQAIHTLDLAMSLTGPVESVQAMAATTRLHQMEAEDFVTAGLKFINGAVGSLKASTASFPGGPESITLHCTKASMHLQSGELTVNWHDGRTDVFGEPAGTGGGADPMAFPSEWHREIISDFAAAVRTGGRPAVSGREALNVHKLIDALTESARDGRRVAVTANLESQK